MNLKQIKQLISNDFTAVNHLITAKLRSPIELINKLGHHIIDSGGKRLRPLVLLLSARACKYPGTAHIDLATTIEFFHTATLLHDDVVDESAMRRGKQTANTIWGSKPSVLVGDYLFTQAFQIVVDLAHIPILRVLSSTANHMTCGEINQLSFQYNPDVTVEDYLSVIRNKTAVLFAAAAEIGALLGERPSDEVAALRAYGMHLGNAFQLIDDALDYAGNSEQLGKQIGDDLRDGKMTLPLIRALAQGNEQQRQLIRETIVSGNDGQLAAITEAIEQTDALEYTQALAEQEIDKALSALRPIADSEYKNALVGLAHFSIQRDN